MKHVRLPRNFPVLGLAAALVLAAALGPAGRSGVDAQAPPPPPPPSVPGPTPAPSVAPTSGEPSALPSGAIPAVPSASAATASPSPASTAQPRGRHGRHREPDASSSPSPEPSATPTSPAFATLDGTWELQLQYIDRTEYSYLVIKQAEGGAINGVWRAKGHNWPFEGTYDGRLIRMLVKEDSGNVTLSGYVEGASDMVGTVDTGTGAGSPTAFTAEHRASNKGGVPEKRRH